MSTHAKWNQQMAFNKEIGGKKNRKTLNSFRNVKLLQLDNSCFLIYLDNDPKQFRINNKTWKKHYIWSDSFEPLHPRYQNINIREIYV